MDFIFTFFNTGVMARYAPDMGLAILTTLRIAVFVIVLGVTGGLLLASLRAFGFRLVNLLIVLFADIGRAIPPLVFILLLYFGLPGVGVMLSGEVVVIIVLGCVLAAFAEEIFWAGITSIDKGQWEAGRASGLPFGTTLAHIVLPQAVRIAIPPLVNRVVAISKMTALGSVIGVNEILAASTSAMSYSASATPLTMGAIAYLIIFLPMIALCHVIERRFSWKV